MSKSLGNLVLVSDLLEKYSPNAVRFLLLSHHYREEWDFNDAEMEEAADKIEGLMREIREDKENTGEDELDKDFIAAIEDDLNTPKALEILQTKKPANLKSHLELLGFKV